MGTPQERPSTEKPEHLLEERIRDAIKAVLIDEKAREALAHLNQMTSIPWEDLQKELGSDWPQTCRILASLSAARLCDPGPLRVRISELGNRLLTSETNITAVDGPTAPDPSETQKPNKDFPSA